MPGPRRSPRRPVGPARAAAALGALSALLAAGTPALAQSRPVDLRDFRPPLDPDSGLFLEPASSPETFSPAISLFGLLEVAPVSIEEARPGAPPSDIASPRLSADVVAAFGLFERALVGFDLPVVLSPGGEPAPEAEAALGGARPGAGLGDLALAAKVTLLGLPRERRSGLAFALLPRVTLPTGEPSTYASEGGTTGEARLLGELALGGARVRATAGVKLRAREGRFACEDLPLGFSGVEEEGGASCARFGHELPFGLGLALPLGLLGGGGARPDGLAPFVEIFGKLPLAPASPFEDARPASLRAALGARLRLGDASLLAGLDAPLAPGVPSAPLRLALALSYAPLPGEGDGDGDWVPDRSDACPDLAEDRDGFEDRDGCPEHDDDADGVPDALDACPDSVEDGLAPRPLDGCASAPGAAGAGRARKGARAPDDG